MTLSIEFLLLLIAILLVLLFYFSKINKYKKNNDMPDNQDTELEGLKKTIKENTEILKILESTTNRSSQTVKEFYTTLTKGGTSVGKFGEVVLSRILENAGLKRDIHFVEQKEITAGLRPDVTINLPDNKYVILDSKVSLTDYSESMKAKDQLNVDKFSKNHLIAVKKHVDSLKKYIDTLDDKSLELVVMFMPIEGAYIAACNDDLISHAIKSKVAIVGPTTLIAILQIITHLWRTKKQSENISKIVKAGTDICNDIINVNLAFKEIEKAYNKANESIELGKKRTEKLVNKAEKMGKMGIPSKDITGKS